MFPKISCLLVTAPGRFELARRSIQCYIDQTYPNRELIIVNEGPLDYQRQLDKHLETIAAQNVRCVWLRGKYTLGGLRNISMAMATGDLFCQWDDDDFCTPKRLSIQYNFLSKHPEAKACYLGDQLHYYFNSKTLYWNSWSRYASSGIKRCSIIPGSVMAYRDLALRYPSAGTYCSAGEDSVFSDALINRDPAAVVILNDFGYMHMYTYHGTNQVWDLSHHSLISNMRSHHRDMVVKYKNRIVDTLNYLQLGDEIRVMCRDGLVFVYEPSKN